MGVSAGERDMDERIAEAEAEVARAQSILESLRFERDTKTCAKEPVSGMAFNGVTFVDAASDEAASPVSPSSGYREAPYVPAKDHVAAGLLAILLGCFGIHKFYLGYFTSGFIMLAVTVVGGVLTFGIAALVMAVVGIVEGILYLAASQSSFEETHVLNVREWF